MKTSSTMVSSKYIVFCGFILLQGAYCAPADSSSSFSYGSKFSEDLNKNLDLVLGNVRSGFTTLAAPPIKFGIDVIPSVIASGIQTAADKVSKFAETGKDVVGKMANGVGHSLGGAAVLGSSIAGGAMQIAGNGLGAGSNVAEAATKAGIDIADKVADVTTSTAAVGGNISSAVLTAVGDTMMAGGGGVNVFTNGLSAIINAMGLRLAQEIAKAEQTAGKVMDNGVKALQNGGLSITASAQARYYDMLKSFLQVVLNIQKLVDNVTASISGGATLSGVPGVSVSGGTSAANSPTSSSTSGASAVPGTS